MCGTGAGETKETCVSCPPGSPPAAGGSIAGSTGRSEQGRMGCAMAGSEEVCSPRAMLVWVAITPHLTSAAVYQLLSCSHHVTVRERKNTAPLPASVPPKAFPSTGTETQTPRCSLQGSTVLPDLFSHYSPSTLLCPQPCLGTFTHASL